MGSGLTFSMNRAVGELRTALGRRLFDSVRGGIRVGLWDKLALARLGGMRVLPQHGLQDWPRGGATWERT